MRRMMAIFLAFAAVWPLAACGGNPSKTNSETNEVGEWTVNTEFDTANLPEEVRQVFDKAMTDYSGTGYTPVAYLGRQLVSGFNYAFLCTSDEEEAASGTALSTVTVYCDAQNNAVIQNIAAVKVSPKKDGKTVFDPADFSGGYNAGEAVGAGLPDGLAGVFAEATKGFAATSYVPLALLAHQVVAGQNYAVLCKVTSLSAKAKSALAVVYLYVDLEGKATVSSIERFEL